MNVKNLSIKNVKSFGEEISINFQDGLNIFIGSNAGGKSNLMDILNITLVYFFLHPWRVRPEYDETGTILRRKYLEERHTEIFNPINQFLEKHIKRGEESQQIKITFCPEREDTENIKNIIKHKEKLIDFEAKEYSNSRRLKDEFLVHLAEFDVGSLVGSELEFIIENDNPIQISDLEQKHKVFLSYLRFFRLFSILVEEYNQSVKEESEKIPNLYPPVIYFSPYRISQIRNLTATLSASDFSTLLEKYEKSDSKTISSTLEVANYYFAKKLRYLNDDITKFKSEEEIKFIKKYIEKLGYKDFGYECKNKEKNIYEGLLTKNDGTILDLSKASGGEKEILNLLLGIFTFNVKNGVIIVDEPELHLHPRWQQVLLELFSNFTESRGIQFFIVTHSPHFVIPQSIRSIFRVYSKNGESQVVPPQNLNENDKELFMLVNIFNNTKVFFANKVILVEGDVDLIIYESILGMAQIDMKNSEIIEIIKVQQEGGIQKNKDFLEKWQIITYGVVDKDKSIQPQGIFTLKDGEIEDYFQNIIKKTKYDIYDAIKIAKKIRAKEIEIPRELKDIFLKIIS